MKGFVPTPAPVVDLMVEKLFRERPPSPGSTVLDPGCGTGAFIDGILRWCDANGGDPPRIVGVELDPRHVSVLHSRYAAVANVQIRTADFLSMVPTEFDYVIGNPPYVPITSLDAAEKAAFRSRYRTAAGRFDLYLLFFERALSMLRPGGRLVFITPEKYLYVNTAAPLRQLLGRLRIHEFHFLPEDTFDGLVTYPLVSTVSNSAERHEIRVIDRDGSARTIAPLTSTRDSWLPPIRGVRSVRPDSVLGDICDRISCGVATGADSVFSIPNSEVSDALRPFAFPTISGRELVPTLPPAPRSSLLLPYGRDGRLLDEEQLGVLGEYLSEPSRKSRLLARTCVRTKPWYAFHETPPLPEALRPKLLCKDIGARPFFVVDAGGEILPRHSTYYIVPADPESIQELAEYLNSPPVSEWLRDHCQRAANGFLRLQSHVLKRLPIPASFIGRPEPVTTDGARLTA